VVVDGAAEEFDVLGGDVFVLEASEPVEGEAADAACEISRVGGVGGDAGAVEDGDDVVLLDDGDVVLLEAVEDFFDGGDGGSEQLELVSGEVGVEIGGFEGEGRGDRRGEQLELVSGDGGVVATVGVPHEVSDADEDAGVLDAPVEVVEHAAVREAGALGGISAHALPAGSGVYGGPERGLLGRGVGGDEVAVEEDGGAAQP
jgi:hypothetical protein